MAQVPAHRRGDLADQPVAARSPAAVRPRCRRRWTAASGSGSAGRTPAATAPSASSGRRHVRGVERAGHRQRHAPGPSPGGVGGELRPAPSSGARRRRPGRRRCVGRGEPGASMRGEHLVRVAAEHGGHAGRGQRAGGGHLPAADARPARSRPRARTRRPARRRPARRRCARRPRRPGSAGGSSSSAAAASAVATSSGWVTAVSRISSASAVVPSRIRSSPATRGPPAQPVSAPGQVQPRGRACRASGHPGRERVRRARLRPSPVPGDRCASGAHESSTAIFVGFLQTAAMSQSLYRPLPRWTSAHLPLRRGSAAPAR